MRIRHPLIFILGLLLAAQTQAEGFFEKPAILGGGGLSQLSLTDEHYPSPSGQKIFDGFDSRTAAWNLFVGFEFNRYLAVEVGRQTAGNASQQKVLTSAETLTTLTIGDETFDLKTAAWHGSVIGSWPVNDYVSFFGRAGMTRWNSTLKWTRPADRVFDKTTGGEIVTFPKPPTLTAAGDNNGNDPYYGGGVSINIDSGLIRLEYDLTKINGFDARTIGLSVIWRFRPW